jgi:amino acid adenylation domain-containing protein
VNADPAVTGSVTPSIRPVTANEADVIVACERSGGHRYHVPVHLRFYPGVDAARLARALSDTTARHPGLRSGFTRARGELVRLEYDRVQVVVDPGPGREIREDEAAWAARVGALSFRLDSAPLLRCHVRHGTAAEGDLVVLILHHAICDGWSADLLTDEVVRRYLGTFDAAPADAGLPAPAEPGELAAGVAFWAVHAASEPLRPITDLIPGADRAADHHVCVPLSAATLAGVRAAAASWRTSPAVLGLVCWQLALHAWSGRRSGYSLIVLAGRDEATDEQIGHFSRALPLSAALSLEQAVGERVREAAEAVLDAWEHARVDVCDVPGLAGVRPSESAVYLHARGDVQQWSDSSVAVRREDPGSGNAKFGFSGHFVEREHDADFEIDVHANLYREETARRVAGQVVRMLERMTQPDRDTLTMLDLLLAADEPSVLTGPPVRHGSLLALVRDQARIHPQAPALRRAHDEHSVSYGELWRRAGAVSAAVTARAAGHGPVAVLLDAAPDTFVTWLGIVLSGRAYLPLDPTYPDAQLQGILSVAAPSLVITGPGASRVDGLVPPGTPVCQEPEVQAGAAPEHDPPLPEPDTAMCVLFTSGSTGTPKGVVLSALGLARLMQQEFLGIGDDEVFSQLSPLNFDGASYEVWGALTHGACLVIIDKSVVLDPARLRETVRAEGVTTMLMTTPLFNRVVEDAPDTLATLRRVYFGGELISVDHVGTALAFAGPGRLVHSYGPTENSFTSTRHIIDAVTGAPRTVPIGTPVPGTRATVVIEGTMVPSPVGMPGELVVDGVGVALGYLGDPDREARTFVRLSDTHADEGTGRAYRTGDRVRLLPSGELEFLGRWDNQVKIRSQRIELGEVEHALRTNPDVAEVVVSAVGTPKELVAYCVARRPGLTDRELRAHAAQRLPRFAVPRHFVLLPQLPLRSNGKIDRSRLPDPAAPGAAAAAAPGTVAPGTVAAGPPPAAAAGPPPAAAAGLPPGQHPGDLLTAVRLAWTEVIGQDGLRVDENFMDAGGNSLMLAELQQRLLEHTGRMLSVGELMRYGTIEAQARILAASPAVVPGADPIVAAGPAAAGAADDGPGPQWRALRLSAAAAPALTDLREHLAGLLAPGARNAPSLGDLAHTLDVGRDRFRHRAVVLADSAEAAIAGLRHGGPLVVTGTVLRQPPVIRLGSDAPDRDDVVRHCTGHVPVEFHDGLRLPMGGDVVLDRQGVSWEGGLAVLPGDLSPGLRLPWLLGQLWCLGAEVPIGGLALGQRVRLPAFRRRVEPSAVGT